MRRHGAAFRLVAAGRGQRHERRRLGGHLRRSRLRRTVETALRPHVSSPSGRWCIVDVYVTDVPEWAVCTTRMPCALEARIAGYAVELADVGAHVGIDRIKEIGSPADPAAELASRVTDVSDCVAHLTTNLRSVVDEADAAADGYGTVAEKSSTAPSAARVKATSTAPAWLRRVALSDCLHFELEAVVSLDAADDLEQVARVGVTARAQHAHEALGLLVCQFAEF